jgi:hypothetical protein
MAKRVSPLFATAFCLPLQPVVNDCSNATCLSVTATAHAGVVGMLTKISRSRDACVLLDDLLAISGALGVEGV